jgi:hypothetical protein
MFRWRSRAADLREPSASPINSAGSFARLFFKKICVKTERVPKILADLLTAEGDGRVGIREREQIRQIPAPADAQTLREREHRERTTFSCTAMSEDNAKRR